MWRTRKQSSTGDFKRDVIARLEHRATEWEKLAASAREREDDGPQNTLRECRPYPAGYWTGMAAALETAARELREVIAQMS